MSLTCHLIYILSVMFNCLIFRSPYSALRKFAQSPLRLGDTKLVSPSLQNLLPSNKTTVWPKYNYWYVDS